MYLIVIAWTYVTLMMAVAEATSPTGTLLGAIITFVLYGALPMGILVYILGTPSRKRAIKAREAAHDRKVVAIETVAAQRHEFRKGLRHIVVEMRSLRVPRRPGTASTAGFTTSWAHCESSQSGSASTTRREIERQARLQP